MVRAGVLHITSHQLSIMWDCTWKHMTLDILIFSKTNKNAYSMLVALIIFYSFFTSTRYLQKCTKFEVQSHAQDLWSHDHPTVHSRDSWAERGVEVSVFRQHADSSRLNMCQQGHHIVTSACTHNITLLYSSLYEILLAVFCDLLIYTYKFISMSGIFMYL